MILLICKMYVNIDIKDVYNEYYVLTIISFLFFWHNVTQYILSPKYNLNKMLFRSFSSFKKLWRLNMDNKT